MRILISIGTLGLGGAEKQAVWLANKLSDSHQVTLLTYHGGAREKDLSEKVKWVTIFPKASEEHAQEGFFNNSENPTQRNSFKHVGMQANNKPLIKIARKLRNTILLPVSRSLRVWRKLKQSLHHLGINLKTRSIDRIVLRYRNYTFVFLAARKIIKRSNPEVVITFLFHDTLNVGLASKLRFKRPKLIVGRRSPIGYADNTRPLTQRLLLRFVYLMSDAAVSNSRANLENAIKEGIKVKKLILIPNYVQFHSFPKEYSRPDSPLKLVCVANFHWYKNHEGLLKAISLIPHHEKRFQFKFVGDGPLLEDMKKLANSRNINATFLGFVQNPRDVIADSHAIILVSHFEGSSNALLEGLSLGMPGISSSTGAAAELKELDCPLLICDSKSIESIKNSLLEIEENYEQLAKEARNFSNKINKLYGEKNIFALWNEIIDAN